MKSFNKKFFFKNNKQIIVNRIFNSVADRYDFMNDLISFGIHRIWKIFVMYYSGIKKGNTILDLAGGTGDIAIKCLKIIGNKGLVVLADINSSMINIGRKKIRDLGYFNNIDYVVLDAENLPFLDNQFDCVIISFGIRNFSKKMLVLRNIYRILKFGGRLLILEFSRPFCKLFIKFYDFYSNYIIPMVGKLVTGDINNYKYLVESIRKHPNQKKLKYMMIRAGFSFVEYFNMTNGVVAIHRGYKFKR